MARVPDSLHALLACLIDYAGLYPPASLPLENTLQKYEEALHSPEGWMVNRVVLPEAKLRGLRIKDGWRITLLVDAEPGPLPRAVETLETKLPRKLSLPTYCEAPLEQIDGAFAKIRTGGVTPDAIPAVDALAGFLVDAAARRAPFKATAGLHHPLRSERPLTYAADSPRAVMHGFVNVFAAAAYVCHGMERAEASELLSETGPGAFDFRDEHMSWRGRRLPCAAIRAARLGFAHSFGSCSFAEPVAGLRELGWLA